MTPIGSTVLSPRVSTRRRRGRLWRRPASPTPSRQPSRAARVKGREAARMRLPLMRASTAALSTSHLQNSAARVWAVRAAAGRRGPYTGRAHLTVGCCTLQTRCNTVRYSASSFAIIRHARSSRINLDHPVSRRQQLLEIDLHAETTNTLDVRAYRGILHHACG